MKVSANSLFRAAGLVTCAASALPGLADFWSAGLQGLRASAAFSALGAQALTAVFWGLLALYAAGFVAFAAAFWTTTDPATRSRRRSVVLLGVQFVLGLLLDSNLEFIVAAEFPLVLPLRRGLVWFAVQNVAMAAIFVLTADELLFKSLTGAGLSILPVDATSSPPWNVVIAVELTENTAWQIFAFCVGYIAAAERRGRAELAGAHAELLATQQLLAHGERTAERLRIARELHDGLGHHLTALNLHLDLAARQRDDAAAASLRTAQDIARRLLTEVRSAVGAQRADQPIDLRRALQTLCSEIPTPRIELSFDARLEVTDPLLAHVIFRTVQEALSNALRHSGADAIRIVLARRDGGLAVSVCDDGKGGRPWKPGNGLSGMRERAEAQGGRLHIESGAGGFAVRLWLPDSRGQHTLAA